MGVPEYYKQCRVRFTLYRTLLVIAEEIEGRGQEWGRRPDKGDFVETQSKDEDLNLSTKYREERVYIKTAFPISSPGDRNNCGGTE